MDEARWDVLLVRSVAVDPSDPSASSEEDSMESMEERIESEEERVGWGMDVAHS